MAAKLPWTKKLGEKPRTSSATTGSTLPFGSGEFTTSNAFETSLGSGEIHDFFHESYALAVKGVPHHLDFFQKTGHTPVAANSTANGQTVPEKYGSWMLVSRRDRRNQSRRTYHPREGVPIDRRRAPPEMTGFENLATQSWFAALEGLDDAMVDQGQEAAEEIALQQANTTLPIIITNDRNKQRQTEQRENTNYRLPRDSESGRGNQYAYQDTFHIPSREGSQNFFRGGYHWANRGNGRAAPRGGPQNTDRGGYPSTYRGNFHSSNGGFRGRHGRGGGPNQAAAEAEHTVVRGSNRGKNITSTVVVHEYGQSSHAMMPGFEHSPKEDPPDREGPAVNEFNFPDVAMTEGMGSDEPHGDMAESHMHS
nr:NFX1-type zinc finger-containing protein 1-like [Ipomoea batatas]